MSKFLEIENSSEMTLEDALESDGRDMKKLLQEKWKEVNRSK